MHSALRLPHHFYSDDELREAIRKELNKEKEGSGKVIDKQKLISPKKFLNSKLVQKSF